jgi:hypothetical protein
MFIINLYLLLGYSLYGLYHKSPKLYIKFLIEGGDV